MCVSTVNVASAMALIDEEKALARYAEALDIAREGDFVQVHVAILLNMANVHERSAVQANKVLAAAR